MFWSALVAVVVALACSDAAPQASQIAKPLIFTGVQPQLARRGDQVFLTYGQDNVISVLRSDDGGQTFGKPVKLTVPGRVSLGMHRGPRIAITPNIVMVTLVAGARGGGADGDLLLYRSTDGGATFAAPVVINDVPGSAREGLHAFAANDEGIAVLAWLDLRDKGTRIYSAVSRGHGLEWSADELLYASPSGSVCECCHPSIAIGSGEAWRRWAVMFRNNINGNRDMYVLHSNGASRAPRTAPRRSGTGSWPLDACPMDGGAVVLYGANAVAVWRRGSDVFMAIADRSEKRLGAGRDPVIDRFDDHLDIAWSSPTGIVLARDGGPSTTLGDGRFPAIASLATRTVVAWESQGTVKILSLAR